MKNKLKNKQLISEYLDKYPDIFNEWEKRCIRNYIDCDRDIDITSDLLSEIYDELDLFDDDENLYLAFIDLLKENFDIENRNIIEVGGGIIPRLGKRISNIQDKGKITVYDPRISIHEEDRPKMKLVREKFCVGTRIGDANLLIGLMPCEATQAIIFSAISNDVDFMIALCEGGPHGDIYDYFEDDEEWIYTMIHYAKNQVKNRNMGKLKIKYFEKINNPYPVIYNKRDE